MDTKRERYDLKSLQLAHLFWSSHRWSFFTLDLLFGVDPAQQICPYKFSSQLS